MKNLSEVKYAIKRSHALARLTKQILSIVTNDASFKPRKDIVFFRQKNYSYIMVGLNHDSYWEAVVRPNCLSVLYKLPFGTQQQFTSELSIAHLQHTATLVLTWILAVRAHLNGL